MGRTKTLKGRDKKASCAICQFKYSCGYSSIRSGKEDGKCPLGLKSDGKPFFKKAKNGMFFSYEKQRLVPEKEARSPSKEYQFIRKLRTSQLRKR